MAITVRCPNPACGKEHSLADDLAGKTYQCPGCQQVFRVPVPGYVTEAFPPSQVAADHVPRPATPPADQSEATAESVPTRDGTVSSLHMAEAASMPPEGPTPPSKPDPFIGAKIAHYRIESLLGRGGMGKVYKARNINLNKTSALKILPPEFATQDRSLVDRFIREARSAAAIEHPNVLPVHFVGKVEENYFIEMQYVDGGTLADLLKKRGRLDVKEAARIIRDVAAGLEAAHKKGIIHRDMKPTNVMLRSDGHVYVADFGLAKVAQARTQLTQQGDVMGTPIYMSPEQALGAKVDLRSDIYSLGIMFYQILSGRPPYVDDSALVILEKHRSSPIPDVSSIVPGVPEQIGAMIVKMMAKRREDRYQSCAEIVQELNVLLETGTPGVVVSEDVFREADEARRTMRLGKRPSRPSSPRKPLRVSKPLAIVLVLVLVLVLGAVAVYLATQGKRSEVGGQRLGTATTAPSVIQHPESSIQHPEAQPAGKSAWNDVYVTQAATGEKIPHPLSRKTNKQTLADGTTVDVPEGMAYLPAGTFTMGEGESEHRVYLDAYFIGKYEVTNAEWKAFVDATWAVTVPGHWKNRTFPEGKANHPVVYVSWEDARKYCDWISKETGRGVRLPTEAQWEKAARGPEDYKYPWGNQWDKNLCNNGWLLAPFGFKPNNEGDDWQKKWKEWEKSDKGKEIIASGGNTTPVGSFPKGKCFYGCYDMAGNVYEWCSDWYMSNYYKLRDAKKNPEGPSEENAEEIGMADGKTIKTRVLRGGVWESNPTGCRAVNRTRVGPSWRYYAHGFRVVVAAREAGGSVTPVQTGAAPGPAAPSVAESKMARFAPPPSAVGAFDNAYVTTAATGEKIPHPLSRKTARQTLADGTTVDVPEGMVYVPAGTFTMGEGESEHRVYLDAYFIGKYEVTNAEWKAFVDATWAVTVPGHWKNRTFPEGKANHPVVYVSWEDAKRYCEWVSKETGRDVRLPTEAQWEKAARGPEDYKYPWGNQWDKNLCNNGWLLAEFGFRPNDEGDDWKKKWDEWQKSDKGKEIIAAGGNTTPVGSFPKGKCFYGCYDMAGNAYEWCADWYMTNYYKLRDARKNPEGPSEEEAEVVVVHAKSGKKGKARLSRGGSWYYSPSNFCRAISRFHSSPSNRSYNNGFRMAVSPGPVGASAPVKGAATEQPQPVIASEAKQSHEIATGRQGGPRDDKGVAQPPSAVGAFDNTYVATAATGEKIPHPLSRKTARQTLADGTTVDVPEGMVYVPAGTFTMGEGESEHRVYLDAYFIGKYEVTNAEWKVFTELASFEPLPSHWKDGKIPAGKENHPVVYVSWEDAQKYCEFVSRLTSSDVRLPTEAQWEKAARGPEDYIYPWGNQWDKNLCNNGYLLAQFGFRPNAEGEDWDKKWAEWQKTDKGKEIIASGGNTTPVGSFPKGKCFYGCYDMAGNVYEWCADWFMTNYFKLKDAKRNPEGPSEEEAEEKNFSGKKMKVRLLRGGSWGDRSGNCRSVYRGCGSPSLRHYPHGFRVVDSFVR